MSLDIVDVYDERLAMDFSHPIYMIAITRPW